MPIIDVYGTRRGPKIKRNQDPNDLILDMGSTTLSPVTPKDKSKKAPRRQQNNNNNNKGTEIHPQTNSSGPANIQQLTTTSPVTTTTSSSPPSISTHHQFIPREVKQEFSSTYSPNISSSNQHYRQPRMSPNNRTPPIMDEKPMMMMGKEINGNNINMMQQFPHHQMMMTPLANPITLQQLLMQNTANNMNNNGSVNPAANLTSALQNMLIQTNGNGLPPGGLEYLAALNQYMAASNSIMTNMSSASSSPAIEMAKLVENEQRARNASNISQILSHSQQSPALMVNNRSSPILQQQQPPSRSNGSHCFGFTKS